MFESCGSEECRWRVYEDAPLDWGGNPTPRETNDWFALTQILDADLNVVGLMFNDACSSHTPVDPTRQEVVAAFCRRAELDPAPFDDDSQEGLAVTANAGTVYYSRPAFVWDAPAAPSPAVLSETRRFRPPIYRGAV